MRGIGIYQVSLNREPKFHLYILDWLVVGGVRRGDGRICGILATRMGRLDPSLGD